VKCQRCRKREASERVHDVGPIIGTGPDAELVRRVRDLCSECLPKFLANQAPGPGFDLEFMHQLLVLGVPFERARDVVMEKLRRDIAKAVANNPRRFSE
jgi:hypothetical protein